MQCFAELISCNGTSEHHHPHRHFPLKLESISRDIWEMQGRLWQRHFNLQHNLFQMEQPDYLCSAPPFTFRGCSSSLFFKGSLASCFCWKCLLGKKNQALCHLHEHFDTVCKCSLCWRCLSWGGLKSCWTLMGTIWRGSFILWQCAIVDTEQLPPVTKSLIYIHFWKTCAGSEIFILISLLLSLPVIKEDIFRSKTLSTSSYLSF